jgi:glucoamylase
VTVKKGEIVYNDTIDVSSVFGVFMFGLFPAGSQELTEAVETLVHTFKLDDGRMGLPRYENDQYYHVGGADTGNLWFVTTLWLAQYYIETGKDDKAKELIAWVSSTSMMTTGVMAEQVSPLDKSFISVAPLTWSHAEYLATLLDTITEK